MKTLLPFIILLAGCIVRDPVQMKQMPMQLTGIYKTEYSKQLTLSWQSEDAKIRIETEAPVEDSNQYRIGMIYPRCFMPK